MTSFNGIISANEDRPPHLYRSKDGVIRMVLVEEMKSRGIYEINKGCRCGKDSV